MRNRWFFAALATLVPLFCFNPLFGQPKDATRRPQRAGGAEVRKALGDDAAAFWIYEDVKAGIAESKRSGKPLLVSIR